MEIPTKQNEYVHTSAASDSAHKKHLLDATRLGRDIASLQNSYSVISASLNQIVLQICELKNNIAISSVPISNDAGSLATKTAPAVSYANIVSSSIAESVKSAVVVSMKNMDSITRDKSSVMFYGMPESKQDTREVKNVFKAMSVICELTACIRLGKRADGVCPRPLEVIFSNTADKNRVLSAAKSLKVHAIFKKVCVSKFL